MWAALWARVYSSSLSRMGMRWVGPGVGPVGEFVSEVFAHVADGQGCEVGEDPGAGGGGVVEEGQEEVGGADLLVSEQGGLAQTALEDLLRLRRCSGCARPPRRGPGVR